ncbi:MAG TPA: glycoside hydrolase family 15 protein [Opitutaceae bacterium]|jgi:GH15 family glucan-1,4-alpha-glucosidase
MNIEDYGLIGDTQTAALVGRNGSIDWMCVPRFDAGACFAALLGTEDNGCWVIAPKGNVRAVRRRYRPGSLVLETDFETDGGLVRLTDCMPIRQEYPWLVRMATCLRGEVDMRMKLVIRFNYGRTLPWVRKDDHSLEAKAGPDALILRTRASTRGEGYSTVADFTLREGEEMPFGLHWYPSHHEAPPPGRVADAILDTEKWWQKWSRRCRYPGPHGRAVKSSLIAIKALTYAPTGGIVAAPTTSLPERLGGDRNWDYRFCWLRDASFTLDALLAAGYAGEAGAWRDWLMRAIAGDAADIQTLYGMAGERGITEIELPHLAGYDGSRPVRAGNAASSQFQLDVYGEIINALGASRSLAGRRREALLDSWSLQTKLLSFVEGNWTNDDSGIWEMRGGTRPFTYSKAMAWVAVDRSIRAAEALKLPGDLARWRRLRGLIRDDVLRRGYNERVGAFTQSYGSDVLDASVLRLPLVGFLPARDRRMASTIRAIERNLTEDGLVMRYAAGTDNLRGAEGVFLPCSFWLADNYSLSGRHAEAEALFERLLSLGNDLGLYSEEYDIAHRRMLGNFPQAFTQVALVNSAFALESGRAPAAAGAQRRNRPAKRAGRG